VAQIKTQNIPFDSFSSIQEKKVETNKSGEEFLIVFNTSYDEQLETENSFLKDKNIETDIFKTNENTEEVEGLESLEDLKETKDSEDREDEEIEWSNLGISWLLESQLKDEKVELEEFSKGDLSTDRIQENLLAENLIDTDELEVTENTSTEIKKIPENVTKESFIKSLKENSGKVFEYKSLQSSYISETLSNLNFLEEIKVINENEEIDSKSFDLIYTIEEKSDQTGKDLPAIVTSETEDEIIFDSKRTVETVDILDEQSERLLNLKIEDNDLQEFNAKEVIEEPNKEFKESELIDPAFERGIEQLRTLRMIDSQTQDQKIFKVSKTEWVNQLQTIITEEVHSENGMDKISTTRIQLMPEHLGKMDIELVLKEKNLTAKLVVEHAATKEWMEQKVTELTIKLAAQNIEVTDFQISLTENSQSLLDSGMQENSFFNERGNSKNQKKSLKYSTEKEAAVEIIEKKPDLKTGRLSMWV